MFSFEIKHVAGKRHGGPNGLSRRRRSVEDSDEEEGVEEREEEMDADLAVNEVDSVEEGDNEDEIKEDNNQTMPDEIKKVTRYLTTLQRPGNKTHKQFDSFRQYALLFLVEEGQLFRRAKPGMPPKRVMWDQNEQKDIMSQLHDESGPRGKKGSYEKVALRYWWKGLYRDVEKWVKTSEECRKRLPIRVMEELPPTLDNPLWQRVGLDVVYMPLNKGFYNLVAMRKYLSGWIEAKAFKNADSKSVAAFVHEWIVRFGIPGMIIHDNGPENKKKTKILIDRYRIRNVCVASYHPQSNAVIERGHHQIVDGLAKPGPKWVKNLPLVVWADRITTRVSTRFTPSPYRLVFGQDCDLPVELCALSWTIIEWRKVKTTAELLAARARQPERRVEDIEEAQENVRKSRLRNKAYFDENRRERVQTIEIWDMVLLYNSSLDKQWSQKQKNKWLGPYKIREIGETGTYLLNELDGMELQGIFAGDRMKKFFVMYGVEDDKAEVPEEIVEEVEELD